MDDAPTSSNHPSVAEYYAQLESVRKTALPELRETGDRAQKAATDATSARVRLEAAADQFFADNGGELVAADPQLLLKRA